MNALMEKKLALERLIFDLKEIELYDEDLGRQLSAFYDQPEMVSAPSLIKEIDGEQVKFELELEFEGDNLSLFSYKVILPKVLEAPGHFIHNEVNSTVLEAKMKAVDWEHFDGWPSRSDYTAEDLALVHYNAAITDLYRFSEAEERDGAEDVDRVLRMVDYLCWKYFGGTRMEEKIIAEYPGLVGMFRHEYHFPGHIHSRLPSRYIKDPFELNRLSQLAFSENYKNREIMNLNNLKDLTGEMKKLGFSDEMIAAMEAQMKADLPRFTLSDQVPATKGVVELTLHFKQSGQSDYYYLNRLEARHNQGRVLVEGEKYNVLIKTPEGQTNPTKSMDTMLEAAEYFRKQTGDAILAIVKGKKQVAEVATMENGKINYINNAFKREFYSPSMSQIFWLRDGNGFNREQAANLVQGRAVYREDLLSREGIPYKAWMQLDTDKERDNNNNLSFRQYSDAYGFDVKTQLDEYKIVGMDDPKKMEHLETVLKNGGRPFVSVMKDGEEVKVYLETAVRYGKLNFYREDGKVEKREQFLKETGLEKTEGVDKGKSKEKVSEQGKGMGM
jgi:hypothetical protein